MRSLNAIYSIQYKEYKYSIIKSTVTSLIYLKTRCNLVGDRNGSTSSRQPLRSWIGVNRKTCGWNEAQVRKIGELREGQGVQRGKGGGYRYLIRAGRARVNFSRLIGRDYSRVAIVSIEIRNEISRSFIRPRLKRNCLLPRGN